MRRAVIFGVTGQDGHYLSELLLAMGYLVIGTARDSRSPAAIARADLGVQIDHCDLTDADQVLRLIVQHAPSEVYNLAGESSVAESWRSVRRTTDVNAIGALNILEALRVSGLGQDGTRFFQASSSEMFGDTGSAAADETHVLVPRSPYGVSKAFAHHLTTVYRDSYHLHASSGILFNHESPLRDPRFVMKKVCRAVARIAVGEQDSLVLGNLEAQRDWSFAGDVVRAMWLMLQQGDPDDYVIASGRLSSVQDVVQLAFARVGIDDWRRYVRLDASNQRPNDIRAVSGDASKARALLGWSPSLSFESLICLLVDAELAVARQ